MRQTRIYNLENIQEAVTKSKTIADVCRHLGVPVKGGSYELIKCRIEEYRINTSHFLGKRAFAGKRNPNFEKRTPKEEILVGDCIYRVSHNRLKRALLESGIDYKCSNCDIETWLDKSITLDIDHIDGNWKNCTIENLRFLCPNCHRQTKTFAGRNLRKEYFCICGNKILRDSKKCKSCTSKEKGKKLDINELAEKVWQKPFKELSVDYGLSDRRLITICQLNNIKYPEMGYWIRKNKDTSSIIVSEFINDLSNLTLEDIYTKYNLTKYTMKSFCKKNNIEISKFYKRVYYNQYKKRGNSE